MTSRRMRVKRGTHWLTDDFWQHTRVSVAKSFQDLSPQIRCALVTKCFVADVDLVSPGAAQVTEMLKAWPPEGGGEVVRKICVAR